MIITALKICQVHQNLCIDLKTEKKKITSLFRSEGTVVLKIKLTALNQN
jgi:hypothetical protein